MTPTDHQAAFDELTAYIDGELTPEDAARIGAHLSACADCRRVEAELRAVSARLATWAVGEPPAGLTAPRAARQSWGMRQWLPLAAGVLLAVGIGGWWILRDPSTTPLYVRLGGSQDAAATAVAVRPAESVSTVEGRVFGEPVQGGPILVRTARLELIAAEFDRARAEMERIVAAAGGFIGRLQTSGNRGASRSLSATLRVPDSRLDETVDAFKRLGRVTHESRNAEDVTQQSADLDARLANARISETRLKEILERRTGDLSDVLAVEREIARVRGEIERMEGERKALDGRITYASLGLQLAEQEKSGMDLGPLSISTRLRNAFIDGWRSAFSSGLDATLVAVRVAPTLLLWALVLALPARYIRRHLAR